jgi:hypothetical protein
MSRPAVRVRSSALLFTCKYPKKSRMPCSLYWGLGSSRLYPKTSSMPSAACLPMEGIQCECPLRSSGLTGQVNLAHSRFRCTFGASSAAPPVWAQPSVRPRTILQLSRLGPQAQLSPISYRHRSAASLLVCGRVVDRDRLHIRKHTRRRLCALRWWLLN